ncbi:MAG: hypothetical protein J6X55_06125 [Victivallales bacterium]|nr:hypothetical protein [Victivallales bacterium]
MGEAIQKNVGTIALIVAIIALVSSLVPQINDLCGSCSRSEAVAVPAGPGGPMAGPGGPMAGPGPRGPQGGPGMMWGGGPSEELKGKYAERLKLFDEAMKSARGDELLKLRVERDTTKLISLRMENGGRRFGPGLAETFLKMRATLACPKATALEKNQAELDYQQQLDRMRGDKEAFIGTAEAFKEYPQKPASDGDLMNLLAAEQQH